jgi:molecular chaperone HscB
MLDVLDSAVQVACWSCSIDHSAAALFCPHCNKIQSPSSGTYFAVFGLKPLLNIDLPTLETEFHRLSRQVHPDRFARASEQEKQWSLADTALLNDAYRTLKEPLRRTEYLLKLEGSEIGEEFAGRDKTNPSRVPADLLEEVFELNMQLDEMRMARKMGEEDPAVHASLTEAKVKFEAMLNDVDRDLRREWTAWDQGDEAVRKTSQNKMVAMLDRRRYLSNLLRDVTETLGA